MRQLLYYKFPYKGLLQNASGIILQNVSGLLQNTIALTKCDV